VDFDYSGTQNDLITKAAATVVTGWRAEQEAAADRDGVFPVELHRSIARAGLLAQRVPTQYGGAGGGLLDVVLISRELGRVSDLALSIFLINCVAAEVIVAGGDPAHCAELLPRVAAGEVLLAFALTEPQAGSDPGGITTQAVRDGDGYVITGRKLFTTGAGNADYILTVARTDPDGPARASSAIFLVPGGTPGLEARPMDKVFGNAHASCAVSYDGVRVGPGSLIAPAGSAWRLMAQGITVERLAVSGWLAGMAEWVRDDLVSFARTRQQFGRPVGDFQSVAHHIADVAITAESIWLMAQHAAWRADREGAQAGWHASAAKTHAVERVTELLNLAIRLEGGQAYLTDHPLQRRLRAAMLGFYAGGTGEIARNTIARRLGLGAG
jgi:alkylation response protein AidB-like acyl-CoA dehydrogenase